jgi:large subunit ribosomal protein L13e
VRIWAIVKRKRRIRPGRGFSRAELKEVNLSVKEALKLGIPVDVRRSTKHDENVEILRSYIAKSPYAKKSLPTTESASK